MYSLKRLTGAVLSRSSMRMPTATPAPSPMASPPPSHAFASLSGKESSYGQEITDKPQQAFQKDKKTAKQAQKDSNDGETSNEQTSHLLPSRPRLMRVNPSALRRAHPFCSCVVCALLLHLFCPCVVQCIPMPTARIPRFCAPMVRTCTFRFGSVRMVRQTAAQRPAIARL